MTTATTPRDPADWSDLSKPEYSGRIIEAKIHGPIGNADYLRQEHPRGHKDYVMSRSEMKNFASCPARWRAGYREGGTAEKHWGSMLDCLLFTPNDFSTRFVVAPTTYPHKDGEKPWNRNAKFCKDWESALPAGAVICKFSEVAELVAAKNTIEADAAIADLLADSEFQVLATATYEDFGTGIKVPVKCCADIVPDYRNEAFCHILADLKTTASVHPRYQDKDVAVWWSDSQAALELDVWNAAGQERTEFRHVLQENYPPWQVGKRFLSVETLRVGRERYHAAMKLYCQCIQTDEWPSHEEMNDHRACINGWLATEPILKPL